HLGIRKNSGADVSSLHHDPSGGSQSALLQNHPGPEVVVNRYLRGRRGNVRLPNPTGNVDPVKQDAVSFELRLKRDTGMVGQIEQRRLFVKGKVVINCLQSEGAIHRPGFEVEEAEPARK